jgi:hypothetical protein
MIDKQQPAILGGGLRAKFNTKNWFCHAFAPRYLATTLLQKTISFLCTAVSCLLATTVACRDDQVLVSVEG